MTLDIILAGILSLRPTLSPKIATQHAQTIYIASNNNSADAAALIVTAYRESEFRTGCVIGIGGKGTYGLGYGYEQWACSPLKIQAIMSLKALYDKGWQIYQLGAFRGYLGAHSTKYPEVQTRMRLWAETYNRLECGCSI